MRSYSDWIAICAMLCIFVSEPVEARESADSAPEAPSSASAAETPEHPGDASTDLAGPRNPSAKRSPESRVVAVRPLEDVIQELLTTARKRQELVQEVPVSVSVIGAKSLLTRDVRRLDDISALVPNLRIDKSMGTVNSARITLRGVTGDNPSAAVDQAVGVYVNGAYAPRSQGLLGVLHDVERVEVIRGPQGTLFGRDTIGGAINVITRPPEFEFGGSAELRVGNEGRVDTRGVLNLPLAPEVAALRISVATNYDRGFQRNSLLGRDLNTDRFLGGRVQLLWLPRENIEVQLLADYSREDRRPEGAKCRVLGPPTPSLAAIQAQVDFQAPCAADVERSDFRVASDLSFAEDDLRRSLYTATVSWDFSDQWMLRSITSFRNQNNDLSQDLDATPLDAAQPIDASGGSDQISYSQELQLLGRTAGGRVSWTLGLYVLGENVDERSNIGTFREFSPLGFVAPSVGTRVDVDNRSYAAYGQVTVALSDALKLTAGLRRTVERKRIRKRDRTLGTPGFPVTSPEDVAFGVPPAGITLLDFERSRRFDDYSPSLALSYQWSPRFLGYVSYATGFRSGGFNPGVDSVNLDTDPVSAEDLVTYEAGIKATFLDQRLLLNVASFFSVYKDIQRPVITRAPNAGIPTQLLRNAAKAHLRGLELELAAQPVPNLLLESSISFFRSRYTDFDISAPGAAPSDRLARVKDASLPGQPDYLMTIAATYDGVPTPVGDLSLRVQWAQRGPQANDVFDSSSIRSGTYGLLDARLGLALPDGKTELVVWGSNLLDRVYVRNGIDVRDSVGEASLFLGEPRRYGLEIRRRF